jgi:hypothetical protein
VSTWGTAAGRAFHTRALVRPLAVAGAHERPEAAHGRPAAEEEAPHERPAAEEAAHGRPVAVEPHGRPAAAVAHERPVAGAPHEQLGAVGEPMVVVAGGHGRPAALGKARER